MTIAETHLSHVRVGEVMHTGILTTDATTPLRTVAKLMASRGVHAVAVLDPDVHSTRPIGFVSALDVTAAAAQDDDWTAGQAAATEVLTVSVDELLPVAARLMADHALNHLIVVEPGSGQPCGVVSTLDVAAAYGA